MLTVDRPSEIVVQMSRAYTALWDTAVAHAANALHPVKMSLSDCGTLTTRVYREDVCDSPNPQLTRASIMSPKPQGRTPDLLRAHPGQCRGRRSTGAAPSHHPGALKPRCAWTGSAAPQCTLRRHRPSRLGSDAVCDHAPGWVATHQAAPAACAQTGGGCCFRPLAQQFSLETQQP